MEELKAAAAEAVKEYSGLSVWITSWARYNEGRLSGFWIKLDGLNEEGLKAELKKRGFDIEGFDEELVIHDYEDYTEGGFAEFGEDNPFTVLKVYNQFEALDDHQKKVFGAIVEAYSRKEALEALEEGSLDDWQLLSEEDLQEFAEDYIQSIIGDRKAYEAIEKYINFEAILDDWRWDYTLTEYGYLRNQ
jgi:antirestriction protein